MAMKYRLLGNSGLRVAEAALGAMTFGDEWGWGSAKEEAKKAKEEMAQLTWQLQQAPNDADLRYRIAQLFLRSGEEEGLRWLLLNLQQHPNHRPSHLALADYYDKQGQTARAADHRRQAGVVPNGR